MTGLRRIRGIYGNACARCKHQQCPAWCLGSAERKPPPLPERNPDGLAFDVVRDVQVTMKKPAPGPDIERARAMGERMGRELAAQEQGLAVGWERDKRVEEPACVGGHDEHYRHKTNAAVWRMGAEWSFASATSDLRDGVAPTRDEAMALALGWTQATGVPGRWYVHVRDGKHHVVDGDDGGEVLRVVPGGGLPEWCQRSDFPSLPHAIAWAMGHDQSKPAAEPAKMPECPKGWRRMHLPGGSYDWCTPDGPGSLARVMRGFVGLGWAGQHLDRATGTLMLREYESFHAACLHALGFEVTKAQRRGYWLVLRGGVWEGYHDSQLPELVDRLTAERAR